MMNISSPFSKLLIQYTANNFCLKQGWHIAKNNFLDVDYFEIHQKVLNLDTDEITIFQLQEFFFRDNIFWATKRVDPFEFRIMISSTLSANHDENAHPEQLQVRYEIDLLTIKTLGRKNRSLQYKKRLKDRSDVMLWINFALCCFDQIDYGKDCINQEAYSQSIHDLFEQYVQVKGY